MDLLGARRRWLIWAVVIPVALWTVVRLFGLERGFPLVPLVAYTPYVAAVALLVAGVALALRNWAAATGSIGALCLLMLVLPRAIGDDRLLPEAVLAVQRDVSGAGLYSRFPLAGLPEPTRFRFCMPRAAVGLPEGGSLRVVGVHPYPPLRHRIGEWDSALESLPATGDGIPWVLVGDFNATLDHAELREVLDRGYRDAGDATGEGLEPTWPNGHEHTPPITIDHVLADERLGIVDYAVEDLPGSDHRAVFARLALP